MPANQGEWVVGVVCGLCDKLAVFDKLKFVELLRGPLEIFASNWEIFRCSSLSPARTAASSELTSPVCGGRIG